MSAGALADIAVAVRRSDQTLFTEGEQALGLLSGDVLDHSLPVAVDALRSALKTAHKDATPAEYRNAQSLRFLAEDAADLLAPLLGERARLVEPLLLLAALPESDPERDLARPLLAGSSRLDALVVLAGLAGVLLDGEPVDVDELFDATLEAHRGRDRSRRGLPGSAAWSGTVFKGSAARLAVGFLADIADSVQLDDHHRLEVAAQQLADHLTPQTTSAYSTDNALLLVSTQKALASSISLAVLYAHADDDDPTTMALLSVEACQVLAADLTGHLTGLLGDLTRVLLPLLLTSQGHPVEQESLSGLSLVEVAVVAASAVGVMVGRGRCDVDVHFAEVLTALKNDPDFI